MPTSTKSPKSLARGILAGTISPSEAMGRADAYDALTHGTTGNRLPFLGTSTKIDAGKGFGILSKVLYMMPADSSGREACSARSAICTDFCLVSTGRLVYATNVSARARKHAAFYADRNRFLADIDLEVKALVRQAVKAGKVPAVRLNGTTDLPFHRMPFTAHDGTRYPSVHAANGSVRFYEYTKLPLRIATKGMPANLHLTFSVSEKVESDSQAVEYLRAGHSAAVVFATPKHVHPNRYTLAGHTAKVVDGDAHDARFLDPRGSVVALAAKGKAKGKPADGFVRNPTPSLLG